MGCYAALPDGFAELGDPTLFAIVERLLAEGELTAGALHRGTEISQPSVSRHLKLLRDAGLFDRLTAGSNRIYFARPNAVERVGACPRASGR